MPRRIWPGAHGRPSRPRLVPSLGIKATLLRRSVPEGRLGELGASDPSPRSWKVFDSNQARGYALFSHPIAHPMGFPPREITTMEALPFLLLPLLVVWICVASHHPAPPATPPTPEGMAQAAQQFHQLAVGVHSLLGFTLLLIPIGIAVFICRGDWGAVKVGGLSLSPGWLSSGCPVTSPANPGPQA
jgi:hypothetical protein